MPESIDHSAILSPSTNVIIREIAGEMLIVPLSNDIGNTNGDPYTVNLTGCAILRVLDGKHTIAQVIEKLSDIFPSSTEVISSDVLSFCELLLEKEILTIKTDL